MAVTVDSIDTTPSFTTSTVTSLDLTTLTVGSGSNRGLVATLFTSSAATGATMFWDNAGTPEAMTLIGSVTDASNVTQLWLFGLTAPTSGTLTLHSSWTTGSAGGAVLAAACFNGVDQTGGTTSFAHFVGVQGSNPPAADNTVSSAAGNYTVAGWGIDQPGSWSSQSQTLWYNHTLTFLGGAMGASATGAAVVDYAAVGSGGLPYIFVGVDIVAAAAGAAVIPPGRAGG